MLISNIQISYYSEIASNEISKYHVAEKSITVYATNHVQFARTHF